MLEVKGIENWWAVLKTWMKQRKLEAVRSWEEVRSSVTRMQDGGLAILRKPQNTPPPPSAAKTSSWEGLTAVVSRAVYTQGAVFVGLPRSLYAPPRPVVFPGVHTGRTRVPAKLFKKRLKEFKTVRECVDAAFKNCQGPMHVAL